MVKSLQFFLGLFICVSYAAFGSAVEKGNPVSINTINESQARFSITNFSPVEITAGTNSILRIIGKGFGASRGAGTVFFKNADDGGSSYIRYSDDSDYISWSDVEINIIVPSYIISDPSHSTPGTGNIIVRNSQQAELTSSGILTIKYALNNQPLISTPDRKGDLHIATPSVLGEIIFKITPEIEQTPGAVDAIEKAAYEWRCNTGVNFSLGKDDNGKPLIATGTNQALYDNHYLIGFTTELPAATLARTTHFRSECFQGTLVSREFDIMINKNANWSYDITGDALPAGKSDFLAVMLHEMGHGIGLEHVNAPQELMYYIIQPSPRKTLKSAPPGKISNLPAATKVMLDKSIKMNINDCREVSLMEFSTECLSNPYHLPNNGDVVVFPNPMIGNETEILISAEFAEPINYTISDLAGRIVFENSTQAFSQGRQTIPLNMSSYNSGTYFLTLHKGGKSFYRKIIKLTPGN